jgi:hypothetical protein
MNRIPVSDTEAAHLTGEMYFKNKIKDTHVSIIRKEWNDTYKNKTAWDFCQCTTEALKKTQRKKRNEFDNTVIQLSDKSFQPELNFKN